MAEYLPKFADGDVITLTASATITGGQVVEVTGNNTVGPAGAASAKVVGVALNDAASGAIVQIRRAGVFELIAAGTINAGDIVCTGAAGTVAAIGANVFGTKIGKALAGATNGNSAVISLEIS